MNKYTIKKSTRYSVNEYTCLQKMFRRHLDIEFLFRELRLTVNECIFVFCAEVFLLLVGFFGTLYITYTLYRKQSFFFFFRGSPCDNIPVLSCFFPSSSSSFFCMFFFTSSVQYNEKTKSKASLSEEYFHCSACPAAQPSLEWSCNYPSCLCCPLWATVCYALTSEKQKVGVL